MPPLHVTKGLIPKEELSMFVLGALLRIQDLDG